MNHTTIRNEMLINGSLDLSVRSIRSANMSANAILHANGSISYTPVYYLLESNLVSTFIDRVKVEFKSRREQESGTGIYRLELGLSYSFNSDTSPDFDLVIRCNGRQLYKERVGLESYPRTMNKLSDTIVLNLDPTQLEITLEKQDREGVPIKLHAMSYYSLLKI